MLIVNIWTTKKWSGRRLAQKVERRTRSMGSKARKYYYYRVTLANGMIISVEDVEIIGSVDEGVDKPKKV